MPSYRRPRRTSRAANLVASSTIQRTGRSSSPASSSAVVPTQIIDASLRVAPNSSRDSRTRDSGTLRRMSGLQRNSGRDHDTPDTDLATLGDAIGATVRVGGLVERIADDGFDLDDGTALARVLLRGDVLTLLPHLRAGEAVAATGRVELVDGAPAVVVDEDGTLLRVGTLGEGLPIGDGTAPAPSETAGAGPLAADSSGGFGGPAPVSLLALASLTALSVLATVVRRRLLQRRLRLALVGRLASLHDRRNVAGSAETSVRPVAAEHELP